MGARFTADSGTELPARTVRHYSAAQEPSGQGTDAIEACFTDDLGNEVCDEATKEWVDTTPPAVACEPTKRHHPGRAQDRALPDSPTTTTINDPLKRNAREGCCVWTDDSLG